MKLMKILIFRNGGLGDTLLTTPAIRGLREKFPQAQIDYLVHEAGKVLLENNPYIDNLYTHKHFWGPYDEFFELLPQYDLVYNLFMSVETIYYQTWDRIEAFCSVLSVTPSSYKLVPPFEKGEAEDYILVHRGGTAADRCWNDEYWDKLISLLTKKYKLKVVGRDGNLIENLSLAKRARLVIDVDSFWYHLAESLEIPSITLFGPVPPEARIKHYKFCHPIRKSSCEPCYSINQKCKVYGPSVKVKDRGKAPCMLAIKPEDVYQKVEEVLDQLPL